MKYLTTTAVAAILAAATVKAEPLTYVEMQRLRVQQHNENVARWAEQERTAQAADDARLTEVARIKADRVEFRRKLAIAAAGATRVNVSSSSVSY